MRSFLVLTALFVFCAGVRADEPAKNDDMSKMLKDPKLAEGMAKVVSQMKKTDGCRTAMVSCVKECTGDDKAGCIMDCETDCSVCAYEEAGVLNDAACKR